MEFEFPKPTEDSVNRPMLEAWRDNGQLMLQQCGKCNTVIYYPRKRCTTCLSDQLLNVPSSGGGTVISFSVVHRGVDEAFRRLGTTVTLASVRTDEGPQIITRIVGDTRDQVAIGHRVKLFDGLPRDDYPLPVYALNLEQNS